MNVVDLGVIGVIAVSAILALMRGFVSEIMSVGGWIGAALATLYAFPGLQPYMRDHVEPPMLADGMTIAGVFIFSLVIFSVVAHEVSRGVRNSALGPVDRSLGLLFGAARGALLVCLAWMVVSWLVPAKDQPAWLLEAKALPLAETGARYLQALVPAQVRDQAAAKADAFQDKARQTLQDAETLHRLSTATPVAPPPPAPAAGQPPAAPGSTYDKKDRGQLDRLIKNTN